MFEHLLTVGNSYWAGDTFCPDLPAADVRGRFAFASVDADGVITLVRDPLGLNKLFVSVQETGRVLAANYLIDLVRVGAGFESIYSVPPGHVVRLDRSRGAAACQRHAAPEPRCADARTPLRDLARGIRAALDTWFRRLARQFGDRRIQLCLSGGLDSGILAALAREYFVDVTGYTYAFSDAGVPASDDAINAERLAEALRIPLRVVTASARDVLSVIDVAICYGQDWRDFNVHCAIVNEILARAMRDDASKQPADSQGLVITGDLANELLADYTPVSYAGREFYALPNVGSARLRQTLVRGLDAGDREIGIFARHGLDVVQPYALVADEYLRLPASLLGSEGFKQALSREIAGDLLPEFIFRRGKVRAQIGDATASTGILPLLVEHGFDSQWLRQRFCHIFGVRDQAFLDRFIRAGRYRVMHDRFAGTAHVAA
jgi:asparagine synthetase B (glutamine-hydrolysing)